MKDGLTELGKAILMEVFRFAGKKGHYTVREYQKKFHQDLNPGLGSYLRKS